MIYLIGACHAVQDYKWLKDPKYAALIIEFKDYLYVVVKRYKITVLAEEYNEDALGQEYDKSVFKDIAESLCVTHLYCDPKRKERKELGIPSQKEIDKEVFKNLNLTEYASFAKAKHDCKIKGNNELLDKLLKERRLIEKRYWPLREKFWFDKIKMHVNDNVLLIAGACHIESFSDLIKKNGCNFSVINEDWKKEEFPPEDC